MIDPPFLLDTFGRLLGGLPQTLSLAGMSIASGAMCALVLALLRLSSRVGNLVVRSYVFFFRGTPLLMLIYLIYFGLSQFPELRRSVLWPFLREPYWCAVLALGMNTAAYTSEIIRGGLASVRPGVIEAGRVLGLSRVQLYRLVVVPLALRQALPAYSNEVLGMVKATALASTITLMEVTGVAHQIISETFRPFEVFLCAGAIYLALNGSLSCGVWLLERQLSPPS